MAVGSWPKAVDAKQVARKRGAQYIRVAGKGPVVLLAHGCGDTGDMWIPLADALVEDRAVIVPDLRGMGLSSHPEGGYEKVARLGTSPPWWISSASKKSPSSPTTSATW